MIKEDFGIYTVIFQDDGKLIALRHGKPWREMTGDNLILAMLQTCESQRQRFTDMIDISRKAATDASTNAP